VIGVLAFNIGIYAWVAARHDDRRFFAASVYTRVIFFIAVTTFAVLGQAGPRSFSSACRICSAPSGPTLHSRPMHGRAGLRWQARADPALHSRSSW
jgi:hypothetical protein